MNRLTYIIFGILFVIFFVCYQGVLSHVIFYHEQHHLFLFSENYFQQILKTEGLLSYITNFVIQFFYIPTLGSAIMALLLASVYLLTNYLIKSISGKYDLLQLSVIPSLYLFFYTMTVEHELTLVIATFLLISTLTILTSIIRHFWKATPSLKWLHVSNKKVRIALTLMPLIIYGIYGYTHFIKSYSISERILLKTEQYAKEKNWVKVLEYTDNYQKAGRSNQLIAYFHNMALYHTGQLPYRLFDYPQKLGVKGLYFPWNSDSRESEYGHMIYEDLGYINEAMRWEFEAMVVWGETAPHLLKLAKYNMLNDKPKAAKHFIELLKQSLFYREEALELEKTIDTGEVAGMKNALKNVNDEPARFINVINIGPELLYISTNDPTNKMAFEYLMSNLLLSNNVVRFVQNLGMIRNFSYPKMPQIYEEALYIYKLGVTEDEFAKLGFSISPETEQRFKRYFELSQNNQMQALQAEFGHTYWFYLNYISPYGNKVLNN